MSNKNLTDKTVLTVLEEIVNKIKQNPALQEEDKNAFVYHIKEKNIVEIRNLLNRYRHLIIDSLPKQLQEQDGGKKKVRKHRGIIQTGGNTGRLRKGYKYTGRRLKNGKAEIVRVKRN